MTYALLAIKRYFASRKRVCDDCVVPGDINYGRSYAEARCERCGTTIWTSVVVEEMRGKVAG